jgi:hypothetical protein
MSTVFSSRAANLGPQVAPLPSSDAAGRPHQPFDVGAAHAERGDGKAAQIDVEQVVLQMEAEDAR